MKNMSGHKHVGSMAAPCTPCKASVSCGVEQLSQELCTFHDREYRQGDQAVWDDCVFESLVDQAPDPATATAIEGVVWIELKSPDSELQWRKLGGVNDLFESLKGFIGTNGNPLPAGTCVPTCGELNAVSQAAAEKQGQLRDAAGSNLLAGACVISCNNLGSDFSISAAGVVSLTPPVIEEDCSVPLMIDPVTYAENHDTGGTDLNPSDNFGVYSTLTFTQADLVALGMRSCDNAVILRLDATAATDTLAISQPLEATVKAGLIIDGHYSERFKAESVAGANTQSMNDLFALDSNGGLTISRTLSVSNAEAGITKGAWRVDVRGFQQVDLGN